MTKSDMQTVVTAVLTALEGSKTAKKNAKAERKPLDPAEKADRQAKFAEAVKAVFAKNGVEITPNVDVFTYDKWDERGYKVKTGEKSIRVKTKGMRGKGIPLFHRGQVEPKPEAAAVAA